MAGYFAEMALLKESSGDESFGEAEDDIGSVASIASGGSDANDEATDPGVIPLAIGLDKVYLTSF